MLFRMESEVPPVQPIRLKVEINCYEHFNVLGLQKIPFAVDNPWFKGQCELTTYAMDELVGTKLRALYQRKKGRDLLDLQVALKSGRVDIDRVLECYRQYIRGQDAHLQAIRPEHGTEDDGSGVSWRFRYPASRRSRTF